MQRRRARLQRLDTATVLQAVLLPREDAAGRPLRVPIADGLLREADDLLHRSHIMLYTSRMLIDMGGTADGIRQGIATAEIGLDKAARKLANAAVLIARHEQEGEMNAILAELRLLQQQQQLLQAQLQLQRAAEAAEAQAGAAGDVEQAAADIVGVVVNQLLQQGQEGAGDAEGAGEARPAVVPARAADAANQQDAANDDADGAAEVGAAQQQARREAPARPQLQAAGVPPNAAAGAAGAAAPQQQQHVPRVLARVDEATFNAVYVLLHLILRHQAELSVPDNMVPLLEDFIEEYLPVNPGQEDYPLRRYPPRDAADIFPLAPPRAVPNGPHAGMYGGVLGMQRFRQPQQAQVQQQPRQQQRQEDDSADTCSSATCVSVP